MLEIKKRKHSNKKKLILACAGGDGTLMFLAQDAVNQGIKLEDITLCILPYGTGNDLAKTLGWGTQPKNLWT